MRSNLPRRSFCLCPSPPGCRSLTVSVWPPGFCRLQPSQSILRQQRRSRRSSVSELPALQCCRLSRPDFPCLARTSVRLRRPGEMASSSWRRTLTDYQRGTSPVLALTRSAPSGSQSSSQSDKIQIRSPSRPLSLSLLSHRTGWSCSSQLSLRLASAKMRRKWWLPSVLPG